MIIECNWIMPDNWVSPRYFWSVFGAFHTYAALVPSVLILGWIGTLGFLRRKKDVRVGFLSYADLLLSMFFITYLIFVNVYRGVSVNDVLYSSWKAKWEIVSIAGQYLVIFFIIAFVFLIISLFAEGSRLKGLQLAFSRKFPWFIVFVFLLNIILMIFAWPYFYHNTGFKGIFEILFSNRVFESYYPFTFMLPVFLILTGYVIGLLTYIFRHHRQALGFSVYTIFTPLLLLASFLVEMYLRWLENTPVIEYKVIFLTAEPSLEILYLHLVFWIMISIWLGIWHFENERFERISKGISVGLVLGIILIILSLPHYFMVFAR